MTLRPVCAALTIALLLAVSAPSRPAAAADRTTFEVTVFTTDPAVGKQVLDALRALGYTNPGNEVLDEPNTDFNIKWGGAPQEFIDEIAAATEKIAGKTLNRLHIFEATDTDIFVNLPLGGAIPTQKGGPAEKPPAIDPQFDADGIPQSCGFAEGRETYGSIRKGTKVILGRHRPVDGDDNWAGDMDQFVGDTATVTGQDGVDGKGCPVVHVDVDKGDWAWRIRDLRLAK